MEMMTMEIAQAGSHGDRSTTTNGAVAASSGTQGVAVASSSGFNAGDYVEVDNGASKETVQLTAVAAGSLTGVFRTAHAAGTPVRLFALPYLRGIIPPAGLGPNSSANVTTLRFFGDINGDGNLFYVVYSYDAGAGQITRSMTPITQGAMNPAVAIVSNLSPNSVQFTLFTDSQSVVTSATLRMTVQNTWKTGSKNQQTTLSSKIVAPSAVAASALFSENQTYGGINNIPPTPNQVTAWASQ
jgi:hypothetical protein